jgi:hypothetical protein
MKHIFWKSDSHREIMEQAFHKSPHWKWESGNKSKGITGSSRKKEAATCIAVDFRWSELIGTPAPSLCGYHLYFSHCNYDTNVTKFPGVEEPIFLYSKISRWMRPDYPLQIMNSLHLTFWTCGFNVFSGDPGRTGKRGKTESMWREIYYLLVSRAPKIAIIRMFCFRAKGSIGHSFLKRRGRLCEHSVTHFLRSRFSLIGWGSRKNSFKKVDELERSVSIDFRGKLR